MKWVTATARIRGSEAGQMIETPIHNEHSEVTGIISNMAKANSFVHMRRNYPKIICNLAVTFFNISIPVLVEIKE
jgi:hypothetical protein